jgi:DNA-binding transcriptional LysR family regulator
MELHQLRMFALVAELGNLTQAAARVSLSQPAASAQIKSLEEEFGVALFERKPGGLVLTRSGASLLPMVQRLLSTASDVVAEAVSFSGRLSGSFKLAIVPAGFDPSFFCLGQILTSITAQHPGLSLEIYQRGSHDIWTGVKHGTFDAGLAFDNNNYAHVSRIILQVVPYCIVAPADWDEGVRQASWKELAQHTWITCTQGGKHEDMAMQLFRRFDCQPGKMILGDNEQVINRLVLAGMGLGLMREGLAREEQACGKIFVVNKVRTSARLQVIYRTSRENDPAIRAILDAVKDCPGIRVGAAKAAKGQRGNGMLPGPQ